MMVFWQTNLSISPKYPIIRIAKGEFKEHGHQHLLCGHICHLFWAGRFVVVGGERQAGVAFKRSEKTHGWWRLHFVFNSGCDEPCCSNWARQSVDLAWSFPYCSICGDYIFQQVDQLDAWNEPKWRVQQEQLGCPSVVWICSLLCGLCRIGKIRWVTGTSIGGASSLRLDTMCTCNGVGVHNVAHLTRNRITALMLQRMKSKSYTRNQFRGV